MELAETQSTIAHSKDHEQSGSHDHHSRAPVETSKMSPSYNEKGKGKASQPRTAKQKVHQAIKKTSAPPKHNNRNSEIAHLGAVFWTYYNLFTGRNLGMNTMERVEDFTRDVYIKRQEGAGNLKLRTVARFLQDILRLGWMAPNSPLRVAL